MSPSQEFVNEALKRARVRALESKCINQANEIENLEAELDEFVRLIDDHCERLTIQDKKYSESNDKFIQRLYELSREYEDVLLDERCDFADLADGVAHEIEELSDYIRLQLEESTRWGKKFMRSLLGRVEEITTIHEDRIKELEGQHKARRKEVYESAMKKHGNLEDSA